MQKEVSTTENQSKHVYIHIYVHARVHTHAHILFFSFFYTYIYSYMHACLHIFICIHACMHSHMYLSVCVSAYKITILWTVLHFSIGLPAVGHSDLSELQTLHCPVGCQHPATQYA